MKDVRVIEVKKSVFESNDERAALLREELKKKGVFFLNLMSSPGSGKTCLLEKLIENIKTNYNMAVILCPRFFTRNLCFASFLQALFGI